MPAVDLIPYPVATAVVVGHNKSYQFYPPVKRIIERCCVYDSSVFPCFNKVCDIIVHHVVTGYPVNVVVYLNVAVSSVADVGEGHIQGFVSEGLTVKAYICRTLIVVLHMAAVYGCEKHCPFNVCVSRKGKSFVYSFNGMYFLSSCSIVAVKIDTTVYCSALDRSKGDTAYVIISKADSAAQDQSQQN